MQRKLYMDIFEDEILSSILTVPPTRVWLENRYVQYGIALYGYENYLYHWDNVNRNR